MGVKAETLPAADADADADVHQAAVTPVATVAFSAPAADEGSAGLIPRVGACLRI